MKYKGLIFDFDYTLGDSTEGIVACVNDALTRLGYAQANREEIRKTIGLNLEETFRVLTVQRKDVNQETGKSGVEKGMRSVPGYEAMDSQEQRTLSQAAEFSRFFREKADQIMTGSTYFFPGALECLQKWKGEGHKLAIVTTKYHYRIEAILEKYQAVGLIDVIVGGEDVKIPKPDPEGLLKVISQWQVSKQEVLYVGDSLVDARTAQAAGVDFAGVTTGTTTKEQLAQYPNVGVWSVLGDICVR